MNVAMIYHLDPSHDGKGGAVRYVNDLIRNLLIEGIGVTLIGAQITSQSFSHENFSYIPIVKNSNVWWRYFIALFFKLPFLTFPPDMIIHVHRIEYIFPFIFFKRKNPLIYTIHGDRLGTARSNYSKFKYKFVDGVFFLYEKLAFNRVSKIIAVSEKSKNSFTTVHPSIIDKVITIPVGVELDQFNKSVNKNELKKKYFLENNDFVILFVGVLGKVKNLDFLLDSFKIISSQINAKLVVVGDGSEKTHLINKVKEIDLTSNVIFTGEIDHSHIHEFYQISNLFVLSSTSEGSPNVIKEALASGIPVLSTNVGDVKEVINSKYIGKVVEGYDPNTFADALLEFIEFIKVNEESIRFECKKNANKFNNKNITKDIAQIYINLKDGTFYGRQ